jgi:hypothetical protein
MKQKISFDTIKRQIKQKEDIEKIAGLASQNPAIIKEIVEHLKIEKTALKFSYEKILRLISEESPALIYPYFDDFAGLLDSENNFIKWGAILTVANLTAVDSENKFDKIFKKYYLPVIGPAMISAANVIGSSGKIVLAKPYLTEKIVKEILKVQKAKYIHQGKLSSECKNIVCGQAVDSFAMFFDKIENKKPVIEFIKAQLNNSRHAVAKKAEKFLKKFENA